MRKQHIALHILVLLFTLSLSSCCKKMNVHILHTTTLIKNRLHEDFNKVVPATLNISKITLPDRSIEEFPKGIVMTIDSMDQDNLYEVSFASKTGFMHYRSKMQLLSIIHIERVGIFYILENTEHIRSILISKKLDKIYLTDDFDNFTIWHVEKTSNEPIKPKT